MQLAGPWLAAASAGTPGGSRPSVALTFDDGYADKNRYAHPLLEGRRLPARFFVTVGLLERDPALREPRGVARGDLEPPTWNRSERSDAPGSTSPRRGGGTPASFDSRLTRLATSWSVRSRRSTNSASP